MKILKSVAAVLGFLLVYVLGMYTAFGGFAVGLACGASRWVWPDCGYITGSWLGCAVLFFAILLWAIPRLRRSDEQTPPKQQEHFYELPEQEWPAMDGYVLFLKEKQKIFAEWRNDVVFKQDNCSLEVKDCTFTPSFPKSVSAAVEAMEDARGALSMLVDNPNDSTGVYEREVIQKLDVAIAALRDAPPQPSETNGTARQFVEWMKAQPEDREPTTIDGALAEFEAQQPSETQGRRQMTEEELVACLVKASCIGKVKMSFESGPYAITRPSLEATRLKDAIEAHYGIPASPQDGGEKA